MRLLLLFGISLVGLVACSLHINHPSAVGCDDVPPPPVAAFRDYVQPALQRCAGCHVKDKAPYFMGSDASAAHNAALPKVNFSNVDNSRFLERILKEKHNCDPDCQKIGANVRTALHKWACAHNSSFDSSRGKQTVAKILSTSSTTELTWNIGGLISSAHKDKVSLSLTVEPNTEAESFAIKDMRVRADGLDVYLGTITPILNGERTQVSTFSGLNCKIPAAKSDSHKYEMTVTATGATISPQDFKADNKLSFDLEGLRAAEASDTTNCWDRDTYNAIFSSDIKPILSSNCMRCHRPPTQPDVAAITTLLANKPMVLAILGVNVENAGSQTQQSQIPQNHQARITDMEQDAKTSVIDFLKLTEPAE
ncbi:MAG: hypothetical protein OYH77_05100 [Pseudomonadota bacterium]|nr:hypothetical protein [Pseudomonadota bacterium]